MHGANVRRLLACAAAIVSLAGACSAVSGLDDLQFDVPDAVACKKDGDCGGSSNPCLRAACGPDGTCGLELVTDPPKDPTPFDCKALACKDGAEVEVDDDADHPADEPCVKHACSAGAETTMALGDGAACTDHGHPGQCRDDVCEPPCAVDAACSSKNACATPFCDPATQHCATRALDGMPPPGVVPVVGDCQRDVCRQGVETMEADPSDVPVSNDECRTTSCNGRTPVTKARPDGTPCSSHGGSHCRNGDCVECALDSECPGDPGQLCKVAVCQADDTCGLGDAPSGTDLPMSLQTAGDCKKVACDGHGATAQFDDDDPPVDPNECKIDLCSGGAVVRTSKPDDTPCGDGSITCVGGVCYGCSSNAQCPTFPNSRCDLNASSPTFRSCQCVPDTCATLGATCGVVSDRCGNMLNCNDGVKNGAETDVDCGSAACPACQVGQHCSFPADCTNGQCVDGFCCDAGAPTCSGCMACSAALRGGAPSQNGHCGPVAAGGSSRGQCVVAMQASCADDGTCDGTGQCRPWPAQTLCGTICAGQLADLKTCDGNGTCVDGVLGPCSGGFACVGSACATSCPTEGAATNCAGGLLCHSGQCLKANGSACATGAECSSAVCAQGVCCNVACDGVCNSCSGPTPGTCAVAPLGPQAGVCDATHGSCDGAASCACDAQGNCNAADGQPCPPLGGSQCASNSCSGDGICCAVACAGACQSCAGGATCTTVVSAMNPNGCDDAHGLCGGGGKCTCDAAGLCKRQSGSPCTTPGQCASGICKPAQTCL